MEVAHPNLPLGGFEASDGRWVVASAGSFAVVAGAAWAVGLGVAATGGIPVEVFRTLERMGGD